jgi:hypothetical protein
MAFGWRDPLPAVTSRFVAEHGYGVRPSNAGYGDTWTDIDDIEVKGTSVRLSERKWKADPILRVWRRHRPQLRGFR